MPSTNAAGSRTLIVVLSSCAVLAVVVLALVIAGTLGPGYSHFPAAEMIAATPSRLAPVYPTVPAGALMQPDAAGPKDDRFFALVTSLAERGGFSRGRRDAMITAAHQVCAMVAAGRSVTDASAAVRVGYGFTAAEAQAVGATGVQVYCPENRP